MNNSQLMQFLQSASNAVAGNVSGPVDLLALGLNKIGVPVGNTPVGGSEWMRRKGLLGDVPMGPARIAGETAGLLSPIAAAQYAPQIARGLLAVGRNAAAPTAAGKAAQQRGAIVFRAGPDYGRTANAGGPTFFATEEAGAKPFERWGAVRKADVTPSRTIDAARGDDIRLYEQFLKETGNPAGRGSTYRPYWTAEHDFVKWLRANNHKFDAIMFDEPTNIPSIAVYDKAAIKY